MTGCKFAIRVKSHLRDEYITLTKFPTGTEVGDYIVGTPKVKVIWEKYG